MEQKVLNGKHRISRGKAAVARLRKTGRLPGVMYGYKGTAIPIDMDYNEFIKLFKSVTESTIVKVQLDKDDDYQAFIKDYQYNIVNNEIEHVDLYEVEAGKPLKVLVGIRLDGSPVGVKNGGVLESGISDLEIECLPKDLPPRITVDVSGLNINDAIHVKDLEFSDAITVLTEPDQVVALVKYAVEEIEGPEVEETEPELIGEESAETEVENEAEVEE